MILSYTDLMRIREEGVIVGSKASAVNAASIDVHLGGDFLHEHKSHRPGITTLDLAARDPLTVKKQTVAHGLTTLLDPGEFVLAHTIETFHLPDNISAKFMLKSSIARAGLNQLSAVWCDAGWNGSSLTLELSNVLRHHRLLLTVGMPIGQMIFYTHEQVPADQSYAVRGRYNGDIGVSGVKP